MSLAELCKGSKEEVLCDKEQLTQFFLVCCVTNASTTGLSHLPKLQAPRSRLTSPDQCVCPKNQELPAVTGNQARLLG